MNQFQPPRGMSAHLASYGRQGDSQLLHVNPKELRGLAALSPTGRLTTNPHTGLPEAKGLGSILGILGSVGGALAAPFTGGSSLMLGALGGGLGAFGGGLMDGKSFGNALLGGLGSGLLGYGAGSALGAIGAEGASEAANLANNGVQAATSAPMSAAAQGVADTAATAGDSAAWEAASLGGQGAGQSVGQGAAAGTAGPPLPQSPASMYDRAGLGDKLKYLGQGVTNSPMAAAKAVGNNAMPIAAGAYGMYAADNAPNTYGSAPPQQQHNYPTLPGPNQRKYHPAPADWDYSTGKEWNYWDPAFAEGGRVSDNYRRLADDGAVFSTPNTSIDPRAYADYLDATTSRSKRNPFYPSEDELRSAYGSRGVAPDQDVIYPGYAMGGPISGPGGGLDDAIPAVINGRQPAKLSSGEYVVPAHAVSALGDGSTEAGVRQLDQMTQSVMAKKYGTPRPRSIRAAKPGLGGMRRGFADGGDVPEFVPAGEDDWQTARRGPSGSLEYLKNNPAYVDKQYGEAQGKIDYLNNLTRRNAPWVLNERLVGKGLPGPIEKQPLAYSVAREISKATIGQPYGWALPPSEEDFTEAKQKLQRLHDRYDYVPAARKR